MSAPTRPRRRHPARVYWVRRALLVGVATLLVVLVARLLGGGGAEESADEARQVAGTPSGTTTEAPPTDGAGEPTAPVEAPTTPAAPTTTPPAQPSGPCAPEDIVVEPFVGEAVGGSPVTIALALTTKETPACTWEVSSETTVVKVTSGDDDIWTTQHCPDAIPVSRVVVRQAEPVAVQLQWPAWRSGPDCTLMQWSLPGSYHAEAAALAGEPTDTQFELVAPEPEVIERAVTPTPDPTADPAAPATTG